MTDYKFTLKKAWLHFKTIVKHKYYVAKFCFKMGLYWQGMTHDLSKFSPAEFIESVKYRTEEGSPIMICKKMNGISFAWQHHKGHNPHHYEYWIDKIDDGGVMRPMPLKYVLEMIADWYGAKLAYSNGNVDNLYKDEIEWWEKRRERCAMHPATQEMVTNLLNFFQKDSDLETSYEYHKIHYKMILDKYEDIENKEFYL